MSDSFNELVEIMDTLREPGGCPWDREQNVESLKKFLLEETYELLDELESGNIDKIKEELGDVLFQVVFLSRVFKERSEFTIEDVIKHISEKMKRRHPHIFSDKHAGNSDEVLALWEEEKRKENKHKKEKHSLLDGVPKHQPSLLRAHQISQRVVKVGFEWDSISSVVDKLREELDEIDEAIKKNRKEEVEEEIGDFLFTVVNISRFLEINSEFALRQACDKFEKRWRFVEKELASRGKKPRESDIDEMESIWQEAKNS